MRRLLARLAGRLGTVPLDGELKAKVEAEFDPASIAAAIRRAKAGLDPLKHFLAYGWREGRDLSAAFSVNDYLELHPDVVEAGENPFLHYLRSGKAEGREVRRQLDSVTTSRPALRRSTPGWTPPTPGPRPIPPIRATS